MTNEVLMALSPLRYHRHPVRADGGALVRRCPGLRRCTRLAAHLVYPAAAAYRWRMPIAVTVPDDVAAAVELPPQRDGDTVSYG
jgi:hypothetical protein